MNPQTAFAFALIPFFWGGASSAEQEPKIRVTPLIETLTTLTGQKLEYPRGHPQVTATIAEIPPGAAVEWHEHPNPRYVFVIEGTLTIEMADGTRREFPAGTIFVEAMRTRHRGMNAGTSPARVLFIDHSEAGQSNMVKPEPSSSGRNGGGGEH
ncbi:MAG TPA: cupin domain-containing protein [Methylocella sp.]|jgi:quercetin dioxygenase-like cupin family protein|nr:cupin domain-containing protein [Methylocella sp.]